MKCVPNLNRHVTFKDLQNYFRKSEYFGDLTDDEKALVRENLGLSAGSIFSGTYNEILQMAKKEFLDLGATYIITDFRSIYETEDEQIFGTEDSEYPSTEYILILHPNSKSTFSPNVGIYNEADEKLIAEYDITPVVFNDASTSRGTITYLRDENRVEANYDFKNIRWARQGEYYLTFNDEPASNVSLNGNNNVFLMGAENVNLTGSNNTFYGKVSNCSGVLEGKDIEEDCLNKQFMKLGEDQVQVYIDVDTQTPQIEKL